MKNPNSEITEIIIRHLQGSASEAEELQLKHWLGQSAENASFYSDYRTVWEKTALSEPEFTPDVDAAWEKVRAKANIYQTEPVAPSVEGKVVKLDYFWKVAAVIVLLAGLGYTAFRTLIQQPEIIEVIAAEKMEIKLPDGSLVFLNKGSRLKYPEEFDETRDVSLTGEAFFEVKRDTLKPFIVQGKLTITQVLGTSFNVRARTGEGYEETTVHTGKVSVKDIKSEQVVILIPGLESHVSLDGKITTAETDLSNSIAWKTGKLVFEDTELKVVAKELSAYYGRKITVGDELAHQKFTGNFSHEELNQVLQVISISTDAKVTKNDSVYILTK